MKDKRTWALTDHLCRDCGGRVLRCVTGNGITPGGNPIYKCADCDNCGAEFRCERIVDVYYTTRLKATKETTHEQ